MEEPPKQSSSCRDCCERVAWSSIVAATFSTVGVVLVVAFVVLSKSPAIDLFAETYIATSVSTWFSWLEIGVYVGMVLMVSLVLLLLSMGCMSTGYQHASTWCAFHKARTGRRQLTAFLIVTYIINLAWYVILIGSTLPTVFFYMLSNGMCSNTVSTPTTCLDLRQFGLAPQCLPDCSSSNQTTHLICGTDLLAICDSNLLPYFFFTLIGCVLVLIGLNHFLMSLSGNYNWLRIRKRRQKLQASKINRRSGTYDVSNDAHETTGNAADRQLSEDSNAHLRRFDMQYGSSSNVLLSSSDSIPTVAAQVSSAPLTFQAPPATTSSSWSFSPRRSPVDVTSSTSSQYSAKISNQTYGIDRNAIVQNQQQQPRSRTRVNFADTRTTTSTTSTSAPTWSTATTATPATTGAKQNNVDTRDGGRGRGNRYDQFNPGFDENYWDHQYTDKQLKKSNGDYYSQGYKSNANQSTSVAESYYDGGGNYNKGYYNYDYDVADGSSGFEMKPTSTSTSTYGQEDSQHGDRKPIAHNFYEYQL